MYRDQEMPAEAIDAFEKGIHLHEQTTEGYTGNMSSQVSMTMNSEQGNNNMILERTQIMKTLAEE